MTDRNVVEEKDLLALQTTTIVTLEEEHNPDQFFQTRAGLYIWDNFRSRVVAEAKQSAKGTSFKVNSFKLMRNATDEQIESCLPAPHLFDEGSLCAVIANLIARQSDEECSVLLEDEILSNLFYTSSCVVRVRWHSVRGEWDVNMWGRDSNRWRADHQVFSLVN